MSYVYYEQKLDGTLDTPLERKSTIIVALLVKKDWPKTPILYPRPSRYGVLGEYVSNLLVDCTPELLSRYFSLITPLIWEIVVYYIKPPSFTINISIIRECTIQCFSSYSQFFLVQPLLPNLSCYHVQ